MIQESFDRLDGSDHLEVLGSPQFSLQSGAQEAVVIDDGQSSRCHSGRGNRHCGVTSGSATVGGSPMSGRSGSRSSTMVPPPGTESTITEPVTSRMTETV